MSSAREIESVLRQVVSTQAEQSTSRCAALDRLTDENESSVEAYERMNAAAGGLNVDGAFLREKQAEIAKYVAQADDLLEKVASLGKLVDQMDEWSKELVVKMRRLEGT
ncbi:hypothetical protein PYCC9005_005286 [Savitreella phatthalungensis]